MPAPRETSSWMLAVLLPKSTAGDAEKLGVRVAHFLETEGYGMHNPVLVIRRPIDGEAVCDLLAGGGSEYDTRVPGDPRRAFLATITTVEEGERPCT